MFNVKLINMPFANLSMPSIALTQLKSLLEVNFKGQISIDIISAHQEAGKRLGLDFYRYIADSSDSQNAGLGDWFFRQVAFPELEDNSETYFTRYFPYRTEGMEKLKRRIREGRQMLDALLDELISKYELDQANLAGFSSMFTQNLASFAMARKLKEINPSIITVMGGANAETPMGQEIVKNVKQIDYAFSGPGLKSFPQFVRYCLDNEMEKCHGIKGVFSKKNHLFQSGPDAIGEELSIDVQVDLDYEPFLESLEKNFPDGKVKPILLFETSRGCWWGERAHCTFCGLNGGSMAYRAMKPELAIKQFNSLFKYSSKVSRLEAVDNIIPKNYFTEVLAEIDTPPNMTIFYEVKADLSEQDVQSLARARVKFIQPGIESLATSTLKLMKKGTNVFQNLLLLKNCAIYGIQPGWNLLIGFPGEEDEVYRKYVQDIPTLVHLPAPSGVFPVRFDRYSPYFVQAKQYGLDLHPLDYYNLIYPFDQESLAKLAYYFADLDLTSKYFITMARWITKIREKVNPWVSSWSPSNKNPRPKLYFKEGGSGTIIYDSRSNPVTEHEVGKICRDILEFLNKPQRLNELKNEFGQIPGFNLEQEIRNLHKKGLIFEESDRYLNLVFPTDPLKNA